MRVGVLLLLRWVAEDGSGSTGGALNEDECRILDPPMALPVDPELALVSSMWMGSGSPSQHRLCVLFRQFVGVPLISIARRRLTRPPMLEWSYETSFGLESSKRTHSIKREACPCH
jgi:hypothetical protein